LRGRRRTDYRRAAAFDVYGTVKEWTMNHHGTYEKKITIKDTQKHAIALIGNPNVGKSVIFSLLTGKYVTVSNYPGTTVEISRGQNAYDSNSIIIDLPGLDSLDTQSEDEEVAGNFFFTRTVKNIIQVADAKNLRRALAISLYLAEAGLPFVLDLNMMDEAHNRGIRIDTQELQRTLGVNVVKTVATQKSGIRELIKKTDEILYSNLTITYPQKIEQAVSTLTAFLPPLRLSTRSVALALLTGQTTIFSLFPELFPPEKTEPILEICKTVQAGYSQPLAYIIQKQRHKVIEDIFTTITTQKAKTAKNFTTILGALTMHPVAGIPFAALVIYVMYKIVGELGAGISVDFLENIVFGQYINKGAEWLFHFVPAPLIRELFVGQYGIITMALTYSIAIVLPIIGFFFIIFGILEDSGYLPRLAVMLNRVFKIMGLNGKAILPMILGLGCDTMATVTARVLPTKKEKIIVTLLLALAVPCSAQLGVIFGTTAAISPTATIIWLFTVSLIIFVVGFFSSKFIPGDSSNFILEIPPLRIPRLTNIIIKTAARLKWYLKEAVPLFVLGTVILFILVKTGLLLRIEELAAPLFQNLLQLPKQTTGAFIMGFLRRDYAAVLLAKGQNLSHIQSLVAIVTITLFVPCIANFFIMIKERGMKVALLINAFIFSFAFLFGGLFNLLLRTLQVSL